MFSVRRHWCAVFGSGGDFDDRIAEDGLEGLLADAGSGFEDDSGLTVGCGGMGGVDEYGELGGEGIFSDAEFGEGDRFAP